MTLEGRRVVKALIGERKNRTFNVRIVIYSIIVFCNNFGASLSINIAPIGAVINIDSTDTVRIIFPHARL